MTADVNGRPQFVPLPPLDRAAQVIEALSTYIEAPSLKAGDRLPAERELMAALAVGRSTIREVIRHFQALGVDGNPQGQRHLSAQARSRRPPSTCRCRSTRRICATCCCRRSKSGAASKSRPAWSRRGGGRAEDLDDDRGEARRDGAGASSRRAPPDREDLAFHLAIYDATHNPLFTQLLEQMRGAFERFWTHPFDRADFAAPLLSVPPHAFQRDRGAGRRGRAARDARDPRHRRGGYQGNVEMNDGLATGRSCASARSSRMTRPTPSTRWCRRSCRPRSSPSRPMTRWWRPIAARRSGRSIRAASTRPSASSRRRSRSSKAPKTRSASPAAWRRSPRPC